jgi:hypothetical protein
MIAGLVVGMIQVSDCVEASEEIVFGSAVNGAISERRVRISFRDSQPLVR